MRREVIIGGFVECSHQGGDSSLRWLSIREVKHFYVSELENGPIGMVYFINIDTGLSTEQLEEGYYYNSYYINHEFTNCIEAECGMRCILQHGCIDTDIIQEMLANP